MVVVAAAALLAFAGSLLLARRVAALRGDLDRLGDGVRELSARLAAAEQDAAGALARTGAAEAVLLEKGLADEEDLEAARRRSDEPPGPDVRGDRELH